MAPSMLALHIRHLGIECVGVIEGPRAELGLHRVVERN